MSAAIAERASLTQQEPIRAPLRLVPTRRPDSWVMRSPAGEGANQRFERQKRRSAPMTVIPAASVMLDEYEKPLAGSTENVLDNLYRVGIDSLDREAGTSLTKTIMNDQKIEKVIFMGPPGVGKSTVIEQMVHTLMADTQGQIGIKLTTFDPAFQATLLAFPKRPLWGKYQWERINGSLYISSRKTKRKRTPERQTHPGREIEIVEVPFVGSRDNSNRGRSFVERVWIDAVAEDKQDAIVFVPFARVKPTVEKSIQLREEISHATTITDQLAILTKYGITFTAELLEKGKAKIEEAVRKLVAQIKNSASKKLLQIVEDDMRIMLRQELPEVPYEYLMRHIALPDGLSTSSYGYETRRDIFYWEMVLDGLGVPSSNRHIMINAPITSVQRRVLQKAA